MKVRLKKEKIIKTSIIITIIMISALLVFVIQKSGLIEMVKNRKIEQIKAEVETYIQAIIDETKQEVQENESRDATLSDLKVKLQEQGYELDEITGQVKYNEYYVTINEDLTIENIEEIKTNIQYDITSKDGDNLNILLTIENAKGIEKITISDITLECNGREKVALDRTMKLRDTYELTIKLIGEEKEEKYGLIRPDKVVTNIDTLGDGTTKTIELESHNNDNIITYYSFDDGQTWQKYTEPLNILEADNKIITSKFEYKYGEIIEIIEDETKILPLIVSDSLLSATEKANIKNDTRYRIAIKDEEYTVHTYVEEGNLTVENDMTYGDLNDVGTATEYAKNMVIVKVNGNLTINEGVTLGPYTSNYGGPKGFLLYCSETLTNNGTIQNNYGAKAEGQNVYLWKNEDESYEYVPAVGAIGGTRQATGKESSRNGNVGLNASTSTYTSGSGVKRATAGGGAGGLAVQNASFNQNSSIGGTGTSYGAGGGGGGTSRHSQGYSATPIDAKTTIGGSGAIIDGSYDSVKCSTGGGAGTPNGKGLKSRNAISTQNGEIGTGGLLIVYSKNLTINNETSLFTAIGANGGNCVAGGGSGYYRKCICRRRCFGRRINKYIY